MHNNIYEISVEPRAKRYWLSESNFYEDNHFGYAAKCNDEERAKAIECFYKHPDFGVFFSRGSEPDTVIYNGMSEKAKEMWYESIQAELDKMKDKKGVYTYRLTRRIEEGFFRNMLFYLEDFSSKSVYPNSLLEFLDELEEGTLLYINSVFNYHW